MAFLSNVSIVGHRVTLLDITGDSEDWQADASNFNLFKAPNKIYLAQ